MKIRKNVIIILNSVIALKIGLLIYIFMKDDTYINTFTHIHFNYSPETYFEIFIINWFCDFLWGYALTFALYYVLSPFSHRRILSLVLTVVFGAILECLQAFDIIPGTFDWWDIAIEIIAVLIATVVLKLIDKKVNSDAK